jgi:hypothetical protein
MKHILNFVLDFYTRVCFPKVFCKTLDIVCKLVLGTSTHFQCYSFVFLGFTYFACFIKSRKYMYIKFNTYDDLPL